MKVLILAVFVTALCTATTASADILNASDGKVLADLSQVKGFDGIFRLCVVADDNNTDDALTVIGLDSNGKETFSLLIEERGGNGAPVCSYVGAKSGDIVQLRNDRSNAGTLEFNSEIVYPR